MGKSLHSETAIGAMENNPTFTEKIMDISRIFAQTKPRVPLLIEHATL